MIEKQLAEWPSRFHRARVDADALHEARRRVLDTLGCFLAAYHVPPVQTLRETLTADVTGECRLWGTKRRVPANLAAWSNGAAVRALDYNDTYLSLEPCHPSDMISSLWAACELASPGNPGETLLRAIVLSYEVMTRLCDARSIRLRGWDHVTYLPIASAVGCSYIFGLNPEQTRNAIALAVTPQNALRQTRVGEISDWKAACAAYAAQAGLTAARLASRGFTGPFDVFAGRNGFFSQVSGNFKLSSKPLGAPWKILSTHVKFYPAEHHSQSAIEAALMLRTKLHGMSITSIDVECFKVAAEIIGSEKEKWRPTTRETADHSLPYLVAAALLDGDVTLKQFASERYADGDVRALMSKTKIISTPKYSRMYPRFMPTRLVIHGAGGKKVSAEVLRPCGYAGRPMTDADIRLKFEKLAVPVIGESAARSVAAAVSRLSSVNSLDEITDSLLIKG